MALRFLPQVSLTVGVFVPCTAVLVVLVGMARGLSPHTILINVMPVAQTAVLLLALMQAALGKAGERFWRPHF